MNERTAPPVTKTIQGHFGPKQITRAEFVKRWEGVLGEVIFVLTKNTKEHDEVREMQKRIGELAGRSWDEMPS